MNVRYLVPSLSLVSVGFLMLAAFQQQPVHASGADFSKFRRIEPQYIAAHRAISPEEPFSEDGDDAAVGTGQPDSAAADAAARVGA